MSAHDYAAVWLDSVGYYEDSNFTLSGNTLTGGAGQVISPTVHLHGDAVFATGGTPAWDGERGVLLEDNTFRDSAGAGVFLDGSSALLSGNTYIDNAADLWQQNCDGVPLPLGFGEAPVTELCPGYDHITAPVVFHLYLEEVLSKRSLELALDFPMAVPLVEPLTPLPSRPPTDRRWLNRPWHPAGTRRPSPSR